MARVNLPALTWRDFSGVETKTDPEHSDGKRQLRQLQNADGYEKFKTVGKIPGSSVKSHYLGGTGFQGIGFYEHFDLGGVYQRRVMASGNGKIYEVEGSGALKFLGSYFDDYLLGRHVTMLDRWHFSTPKNEPQKYDGDALTEWGARAPGAWEYTLQAFDDESAWSITGGTKADETVVAKKRTAVTVNKTTTAAAIVAIERTGQNMRLDDAGLELGYIWFFMPEGTQKLLDVDEAVEIQLGDDATDYDKWTWTKTQLTEGWNLLILVLDTPDGTGGAGLTTLADVDYMNLIVRTSDSSFLPANMRWSHFHKNDEGAIVANKSGSGAVTGNTVSYRMVGLTKYGQLTNAGPVSNTITLDAGGNTIHLELPIMPDPQVVARWIYRDTDSDALWTFVAEIEDNTTLVYDDNVSNAAKSSATPPLAADDLDDNTVPSRFRQVVKYRGHIFGLPEEDQFALEISDFDEPESFPLLNTLTFDSDLKSLRPHRRGVLLCASDKAYLISGDAFPFDVDEIHPETGASGERGMTTAHTTCMVWHDDGPYIHDGVNPWFLGTDIKDQIDALDAAKFDDAIILHDRGRFRTLCLTKDGSGNYTKIFQWSYGQAAGVITPDGYGIDPQDLRRGWWSTVLFPASYGITDVAMVERTADKPELWAASTDGWIYRLQDPDSVDWAIGTSSTEAVATIIDCEWQEFGDRERLPSIHGYAKQLLVSGYAETRTTWSATVECGKAPDDISGGSVTFDVVIGPGATETKVPVPSIPGTEDDKPAGTWGHVRLENAKKGEHARLSVAQLQYVPSRNRGAQAA